LNVLTTMRQRQAPWTRSVLGLFVVVWLNMVLQPCAMAFGDPNNPDRAHCPTMQTEETTSQSAYDAAESAGVLPYETSAAQCAFIDDFNYDGRMVEAKVKNEPSDETPGVAAPFPAIALEKGLMASPGAGNHSFFPGDPPPLNVLYCVYLI